GPGRDENCEGHEDERADKRGGLGHAWVPRRVLSDPGHREKHERLLTAGISACPRVLSGCCRSRMILHQGNHLIRISGKDTILSLTRIQLLGWELVSRRSTDGR